MNKRILITGGNRGIGFALVNQFCLFDWHVMACCRAPNSAVALQEWCNKFAKLEVIELDVCDESAIIQLGDRLNPYRGLA